MDWATRKVLTWRLSNTLDASFCVEALAEAIARYGKPEIMNTDQGSQYTGTGWITTLIKADIKISMPLGDFTNHLPVIDGRGRYHDNIFIERLWRSLKQEAVYLHQITDGFQAKRIIDNWISSTTRSALTPPLISEHQKHQTSHTWATWRHEKRHEHTRCILAKPQTCPNKQDHFTGRIIASDERLENHQTLGV
jgi:putative transposase